MYSYIAVHTEYGTSPRPMKPQGRDCLEAGRASSLRDPSKSTMSATTRAATRHVCIGDMEEELHKAFAMAR